MRILVLTAIAVVALAGVAQAGDSPTAQMDFFQGCWRGAFAGSTAVTDTRCFAPMLGGQYVRDTHVVHGGEGPYSGETVYYVDGQTRRPTFTYFASDGGVAHGTADAGDGQITFPPGEFVGADGQILTMRATWRAQGNDRYVSVAEIEDHGQWREHLRITYTRAPDLSPPAE